MQGLSAEGTTTVPHARDQLLAAFQAVRNTTMQLVEPLETEDCLLQSMPDASPTKWHLAHTTWFFETFLLRPHFSTYREFDPNFSFLFNSYYEAVGPRWTRARRGMLSRPGLFEVIAYRKHVDQAMARWLSGSDFPANLAQVVTLGLNHEQQHQELILTDIKHALAENPLHPAYITRPPASSPAAPARWLGFAEQIVEIGHKSGDGFAFDNETPRHRVLLQPYQLANRLVTCGQYLEFIDDGGYRKPDLWLSEGWALCQAEGWEAPLYWERNGDDWRYFTLTGTRPVTAAEPVTHVSFFEADAFARWAEARLPTEFEWESAVRSQELTGHFLDAGHFHPVGNLSEDDSGPIHQAFGEVWQWTGSAYLGYPGYQPLPGALGEYNGKFMCNQFVLRGASCVTPRSHARTTYRNFFPPAARWQFTGIRLARNT